MFSPPGFPSPTSAWLIFKGWAGREVYARQTARKRSLFRRLALNLLRAEAPHSITQSRKTKATAEQPDYLATALQAQEICYAGPDSAPKYLISRLKKWVQSARPTATVTTHVMMRGNQQTTPNLSPT